VASEGEDEVAGEGEDGVAGEVRTRGGRRRRGAAVPRICVARTRGCAGRGEWGGEGARVPVSRRGLIYPRHRRRLRFVGGLAGCIMMVGL
jgi:hypothetical protein